MVFMSAVMDGSFTVLLFRMGVGFLTIMVVQTSCYLAGVCVSNTAPIVQLEAQNRFYQSS
jgi:hypothetical protein